MLIISPVTAGPTALQISPTPLEDWGASVTEILGLQLLNFCPDRTLATTQVCRLLPPAEVGT